MNDTDLKHILEGITNAKRIYRDRAALAILDKPRLISKLIDKIYDIEDPLHIKAACVFELVCLENISLLDPYIHHFLSRMSILKQHQCGFGAFGSCAVNRLIG